MDSVHSGYYPADRSRPIGVRLREFGLNEFRTHTVGLHSVGLSYDAEANRCAYKPKFHGRA